MKDVRSGMGVKNISDLVWKEIHGILKTKSPTKEQIKKYKTTEREIFEEFDNLSDKELNTKSNKNVYVKSVVMNAIIKRCRGEQKTGVRATVGFIKIIMIPDSEIPECPEFEVKWKIGKWFMNDKILEEYFVKIYKIYPFLWASQRKNKSWQKWPWIHVI